MKPKEWAKANGFPNISLGKGRMPSDARAAVEAAVARGVFIDGYAVKATTATDKPATVERVAVSTTATVSEHPEETMPERNYIAMVGSYVIGNRTVCDVCKRSLNYHICQSPRVMFNGTSSVVSFKARPNPETFRNKWW